MRQRQPAKGPGLRSSRDKPRSASYSVSGLPSCWTRPTSVMILRRPWRRSGTNYVTLAVRKMAGVAGHGGLRIEPFRNRAPPAPARSNPIR